MIFNNYVRICFGIIVSIFVIIINYSIYFSYHSIDYCDSNMCKGKDVHIACNVPDWDTRCINPYHLRMATTLKKRIVDTHNYYRNLIASGKLPGFEPAVRMPAMSWDNELAYLATLNTKQCKMEHDQCRATYEFPYSGQNLAFKGTENPFTIESMYDIIEVSIGKFFQEYELATQADIDNSTKRDVPPPGIGHFTALVHEKSAFIGCGVSIYNARSSTTERKNNLLLACNYSFTNFRNLPIYVKGPKSSKCITGTHSDYDGLCSLMEKVVPLPR